MRHHGVNLEEETQMVDGDFYSREVVASSVRPLQSYRGSREMKERPVHGLVG
jgi:hypothetical protein